MDSNGSKYSALEHKLMKVSAPRKEEDIFEQQNDCQLLEVSAADILGVT
jgi:hypothetical protein